MVDKNDKNDFDNKPFSESAELFEKLYREALDKRAKERVEGGGNKKDHPPSGLNRYKKQAKDIPLISDSEEPLTSRQGNTAVEGRRKDHEPHDIGKTDKRDLPRETDLKKEIKKRPAHFIFVLSGVIFLIIAGLFFYYFRINIAKVTPEKEAVSIKTQAPLAKKQAKISVDNESVLKQGTPVDQGPSLTGAVTGTEGIAYMQAAASDMEKTAFSYPYSVYLGSYSNAEKIRKAMGMYGETGLEPYYVKVDLGEKGIWFRLYTGFFQTRNEAQKFIDTKKIKDATVKSIKYANLIGAYTSREILEEKRVALIQLQYSPYVITEGNNHFFLYVGGFYEEAGAKEQNIELASKGIQGMVVER